jgi:hypothetical protein
MDVLRSSPCGPGTTRTRSIDELAPKGDQEVVGHGGSNNHPAQPMDSLTSAPTPLGKTVQPDRATGPKAPLLGDPGRDLQRASLSLPQVGVAPTGQLGPAKLSRDDASGGDLIIGEGVLGHLPDARLGDEGQPGDPPAGQRLRLRAPSFHHRHHMAIGRPPVSCVNRLGRKHQTPHFRSPVRQARLRTCRASPLRRHNPWLERGRLHDSAAGADLSRHGEGLGRSGD